MPVLTKSHPFHAQLDFTAVDGEARQPTPVGPCACVSPGNVVRVLRTRIKPGTPQEERDRIKQLNEYNSCWNPEKPPLDNSIWDCLVQLGEGESVMFAWVPAVDLKPAEVAA